MQYIEGEDLSAILQKDGRLRPYRAIDVCRQVAAALDAAHAMGLIHRDVKPANVLIEGRTAFLTDFGLTKQLEGTNAQITRVGDVVGTIHYVAPEQIEGRKVSARTDVYSLGCLLYHCLSGQVPFSHDTDVAVIYAHLSEEPTKLSTLQRDLPEGLDAIVAKALDKSPDRRFPSCGDMISAARAVLDAAGPLGDTSPPRHSTGLGTFAPATPEVRDAAAAARRPRVLLGGLDDRTRAVARVALGDRVDVLEAPGRRDDGHRPRGAPGPRDRGLGERRRGGDRRAARRRAHARRQGAAADRLRARHEPRGRLRGGRRPPGRTVLAAAAAGQAAAAAGRRGHRRVTPVVAVLAGGEGGGWANRSRWRSWAERR